MPPLPRLTIPCLRDLARQAAFAPHGVTLRQIERAEELTVDVDPSTAYPEDWITFRITGYRTDVDSPAMVVGEALLGDLSAFAEHLCVSAGFSTDDLTVLRDDDGAVRGEGYGGSGADGDLNRSRSWLTVPELCERWNVSRKTIDRYRRLGLVGRRVRIDARVQKLMFAQATVERFETARADVVGEARQFSRIPEAEQENIVRLAHRCRVRFGYTLNEIARRIAPRVGRGHETIRQLLRKHDEGSDNPIFAPSSVLDQDQREAIETAYQRGVGPRELANEHGRTVASIYRILRDRRAERLRTADLSGSVGSHLELDDAADALAASKEVHTDLVHPAASLLSELLIEARTTTPPDRRIEHARAAAYRLLCFQAADRIVNLSRRHPSAADLDEIETRLRWASMLKAELVRTQQGLIISTIDAAVPRPITTLPPYAVISLVDLLFGAAIEGVDRFDPFGSGRLAAPVGIQLNRAVARWLHADGEPWSTPLSPAMATPKVDPTGIAVLDWTTRVSAWQEWLEIDSAVHANIESVDEPGRTIVTLHYGLAGDAPDILAIAELLSLKSQRVARIEREAMQAARKTS